MEEKVLIEILEETKEEFEKDKANSLSRRLIRGKKSKEIREQLNNYKAFKKWANETAYSINTLNRDIRRYEMNELMKEEAGKEMVVELACILLSWINKLKKQNEEKYMGLILLIDKGLNKKGIKSFLEENITEESTNITGKELRECIEEIGKGIKKLDIGQVKHKVGKRVLKGLGRVLKLISESTNLNIVKRNKEIVKNVEKINYGLGVLNLN